jgi:hypothetical protein
MATPWGSFSYRVLPMGMANSPSAFQRTKGANRLMKILD